MALECELPASGHGASAATFFAAYAFSQLPVGLVINPHRLCEVQVLLSLVAALGFLLCALATDPMLLAIGRFVTGIGISGALIGLLAANMNTTHPGAWRR